MMSLQCPLCNIDINDTASLQVHYSYTHGQHRFLNLSASSAPSPEPEGPNAQPSLHVEPSTSTNNNPHRNRRDFFKPPSPSKKAQQSAMSAADNPEFQFAPIQHQYTMQPLTQQQQQVHFEAYLFNEYNNRVPAAGPAGYLFNERRIHPYYKQGFREVVYIPRCDKCNAQFASQEMLLHHINVVHASSVQHPDAHTFLFADGAAAVKSESQAEILDLDSQKVHLYQPPNGQNAAPTPSEWPGEDKKYFHNGGGTPLPSPEFGNVSTTTDIVPLGEPQPEKRRPAKKGSAKSANGAWKSNEARRPKTYNCSACNKWFTSSGHLKRHYNTTLHKNAVQQSGAPDPATLPVSAHYRPYKETAASVSPQIADDDSPEASSPLKQESVEYRSGQLLPKLEPIEYRSAQLTPKPELTEYGMGAASAMPLTPKQEESVYGGAQLTPEQEPLEYQRSAARQMGPLAADDMTASFPNLCTAVAGGLLQSTYVPHRVSPAMPQWYVPPPQQQQPPSPQQQQQDHHQLLQSSSFFQQATPTALYPNFQSPHVSTTNQVTTTNSGGEDLSQPDGEAVLRNIVNDSKLPGFECIQLKGNAWHATTGRFLGTLDCGDVGGPVEREEDAESTGEPALILMSNVPIEKRQPVCSDEDESCEPRVSSSTERALTISSISESNAASAASAASAARLSYSCDPCNKIFNRACYLTQHNKSFHSGHKPFKCARCGKRFMDLYRLHVHTEKHAGDKPYKCDICPKAFNHKTDLRRHACLHTNVRPFSCDICSKGFIRKDHMLKHRETHQNRKSPNHATRGRLIKVSQIKAEVDALKVTC